MNLAVVKPGYLEADFLVSLVNLVEAAALPCVPEVCLVRVVVAAIAWVLPEVDLMDSVLEAFYV